MSGIPPEFGQPLTGGFTHTFSDPDGSIFKALSAPTATIRIRYRAKWWRRPWLWLRRKPTSSEHVIEGVHFSPMTIHEDGSATVNFMAEPKP